ncbi:MAG TPA: single-stranded-DNA-specific exonuclease RecJ [Thermoanaerobaculia bacterium]|nr:single-stranded-DNA-specific exonuclease RecJ [Thermoanaerobaculia bacterium]
MSEAATEEAAQRRLPDPPSLWEPAPACPATAALEAAGYSSILAPLLARRGAVDQRSAERFLAPGPEQLHDPFDLAGMEQAVVRLERARARGERVAIVGDYDVDGVTGAALLAAVLAACGIEREVLLPHRMIDGYGFQPVHVDRALELGCRLVVTVDCGTSSAAAIERAVEAGIDVVVTDHHLPPAGFPQAAIQVNPRQPGCRYPFRELSGVGLAFKLATALLTRVGRPVPIGSLLRIACLGTIADLVSLEGENRVIATLGLRSLADTRSVGLRALMRIAGVKPPLTAADVGFRLGPRINAAGRLDTAELALELLLTRDEARAEELAALLDATNRDRQAEERRVVEEAVALFSEVAPLPGVLVAWSPGWHRGVVGIAAGRLAQRFHRPTLLLSVDGELATGSGRSIPGVHLHGFLDGWRDRLVKFGGHAAAIGLTARTADLELLRETWCAAADWPEHLLTRRYEYEIDVPTASRLDVSLFAEVARLEPFGPGNPAPLVRVGPLDLLAPPRIFGNGHLSAITVGADGGRVRIVGWGWEARAHELEGRFEALGLLDWDDWVGAPALRLVDVRRAVGEGASTPAS